MKRVRTSLFFAAVLGGLALWGSVWGVEGSNPFQGLISHWKFDEGSGTTAYDLVGDNDGTIYGAQWTTGQMGGALSFDGVDDYVALQSNAVTTTEFTLAAWANHYGLGGGSANTNPIFQQRDDDARVATAKSIIVLHTEHTGDDPNAFAYVRSSSGPSQILTYPKKNYNEWHHYAITVDSDDLVFYIDGVEVDKTSNIQTGDYVTSIDYVEIGRHRCNGITRGFFNGAIDEVAIYNRALSAEEIQQLYQGVFPELVGLEIVGPNEVAENFEVHYKAVGYYENGSTKDVTSAALWAVEPNTAANIDENGVLTTKDIVKDQPAIILASYTEGDVTVEAEKAIDIFTICPTGTALQFDGVDDYIKIPDAPELRLLSTDFAIGAWIKPNSITTGVIISKRNYDINDGSGDNAGWGTLLREGELSFVIFGTAEYSTAGANIKTNTWQYVTYVFDASNNVISVYKDGGFLENLRTGEISFSDKSVIIGAASTNYPGPRAPSNGTIDEVAVYNRALSAEEIRANMHRQLAGDEPGLVGYWGFDEGGGQIVYDLSGNGNDGQLGSTPSPDVSDPAWVESDAPIGICSLHQIATMAAERAVERKTWLLEELLAALAEEWTAYEALEEWLESGDYGDLNYGDIVTAKQKIHSATQHQEQSIGALEKSVEKLEDALSALGYEPNTAANIDENGVLTTKDIVKDQSATILAGYTEGDVTVNAEKPISIFAICPTGTALQFDGVNDYVDFSRNIITTTEFTVSAWANHYGLGGGSVNTNIIFSQRDDVARHNHCAIALITERSDYSPYAAAGIRSSSGSTQALDYPKKNYNEWHHYAMTVNSSDFIFYIDGVEVDRTSNRQAGDYVTSIDYVTIGRAK